MSCNNRKDDANSAETQHIDQLHGRQTGNAINAWLIFTCTVFGAASFLFGFDDKIISPIAALTPFVSDLYHDRIDRKKLIQT